MLDTLKDWIGQSETLHDEVTVPAVARLAALLDLEPVARAGDPLPPGWHSILFPRVVRQARIGTDGHPERGDFLPPVPLPRRMFAGRRVRFADALRVGDTVTKISTIHDVAQKEGRSGKMVFVTVRAEIHSPRGLAIVEEQDIVYRAAAAPGAPAAAPQREAAAAAWSRIIVPDEVMLFRYSALCYNGHRIHYDREYATRVEGYPALVVNGGFTNLLLYELARANAHAPVVSFASRNLRPMFVNRAIRLEGAIEGKDAKLWALDDAGALAVSVDARLA